MRLLIGDLRPMRRVGEWLDELLGQVCCEIRKCENEFWPDINLDYRRFLYFGGIYY